MHFVCPCASKTPLHTVGSQIVCEGIDCPHNSITCGFGSINGKPVLISDQRCDTVCDPARVQSLVERRTDGRARRLVSILLGTSKVTRDNCRRFVEVLTLNGKTRHVLVVGSGTAGSGTDELYSCPGVRITGIDVYESATVDCIADAHYIPLPDDCIDGVWIQAVLEHVVEPGAVVAEIHRVLKADGLVYAETPFMQQVHEGAFDFTRFTVLGHRYLFRDFEMIDCGGNKGPAVALAWSIRYFFWALFRNATIAKIIGLLSAITLRPLELLTDQRALHDASSGVFFFGKRSDKRIKHRDLEPLYNGLQKSGRQ